MIELIPISFYDYVYDIVKPNSYFFHHEGFYYGYVYTHRHPFMTKEYKEFQRAITTGISQEEFIFLQRILKLELI
jgi:hypothetical protein